MPSEFHFAWHSLHWTFPLIPNFVEVSGKVWSMSKPLRHFETNLISLGFFRIHRSYMVNLQHLRRLDKVEGLAYLINEEAVPYNKDHAKKLIQLSEE